MQVRLLQHLATMDHRAVLHPQRRNVGKTAIVRTMRSLPTQTMLFQQLQWIVVVAGLEIMRSAHLQNVVMVVIAVRIPSPWAAERMTSGVANVTMPLTAAVVEMNFLAAMIVEVEMNFLAAMIVEVVEEMTATAQDVVTSTAQISETDRTLDS